MPNGLDGARMPTAIIRTKDRFRGKLTLLPAHRTAIVGRLLPVSIRAVMPLYTSKFMSAQAHLLADSGLTGMSSDPVKTAPLQRTQNALIDPNNVRFGTAGWYSCTK